MKLFKRRLEKLEKKTNVEDEDEEPIVLVFVQLDEAGNAVETGRRIIEKPTAEERRAYSKDVIITWDD